MVARSAPDGHTVMVTGNPLITSPHLYRNVPFEQTVDLVQRLRAQHVPFEQLIIPDEIHGFLRWHSWIRAYTAEADFFDRTLKKGEKISTD